MNERDDIIQLLEHLIKNTDSEIVYDLFEIKTGDFTFAGEGSSRIVLKKGNLVYKFAFKETGLLQNKNEWLNQNENIAKTIDSITYNGIENFINIQEYCKGPTAFFFELLGGNKYINAEVIQNISLLVKQSPRNVHEVMFNKILLDIAKSIDDKALKDKKYKGNTINRIINAHVGEKFFFESMIDPSDLLSQNMGVKLDERGQYERFLIVDNGLDEEVSDIYSFGEVDEDIFIDRLRRESIHD